MRTHSAFQIVCVPLLLVACTGGPLGNSDADSSKDGAAGKDLVSRDDGGDCIGLGQCDCRARKDCQPITESCWCPTECDPNGPVCACGGGAFIGCAPPSSNCPSTVDCRLAGRHAGPDGKGCWSCGYSDDCAEAKSRLKSKCLSEVLANRISCDKNPACVTKCINDVKQCTDIGCLCAECDCKAGSFDLCYFACIGQ